MNWIKQIKNENYIASKEWLERKASDEFSKKQDVEHSWGMKIENQIKHFKSETGKSESYYYKLLNDIKSERMD